MFVCICRGLTERDLQGLGARGIRSAEALIATLDLEGSSCCGRCACNIEELTEIASRPLPVGNVLLPLVGVSSVAVAGRA
jgi:bacterioferritin-associated ferredoxin